MEKNAKNSGAQSLQETLDIQTAAILNCLELQREILRMLQELTLGDGIGNAAADYQQKMAVVNGGMG